MTGTASTQKHEYFIEKPDEVRFLDPVLGVELQADQPPPSLTQDALAVQGFAQLEKLAAEKRLTVQLVQSFHGGREDFEDVLRDFGDVLLQADMVGIETDWKSSPKNEATSELLSLSSIEYVFASFPGRQEFQKEQLAWLAKHKKLALPCEYPDDNESEFSRRFNDVVSRFHEARKLKDSKSAIIFCGAYQTTRQWMFLAQLGYWLRVLENENRLSEGPLKIPFMSGTHQAVERKLNNYFKIPTEYYLVDQRTLGPSKLKSGPYDEVFNDMTAHARITRKQLDNPFYFN